MFYQPQNSERPAEMFSQYRNIEEFTREEVRGDFKVGFSVADLYNEASYERKMNDFEEESEED